MIVGSGIDVIEVARIERALERRGDRFARRVFSAAEIEECRRGARPALQFALRFAVKEATMKAFGTGWARGVRWLDIEATGEGRGRRLRLALRGAAAGHACRLGAVRHHVGVATSGGHAFAVVVLEGEGA